MPHAGLPCCMGLAALRKVLDPQQVPWKELHGQTVAVDANNMLWSFVTGMGVRGDPPTGPHGRVTSHVIGLVNRLRLYSQHGVQSIWVFDGEQPDLKEDTLAQRRERIQKLLDQGRKKGAIMLTREQIQESKQLLSVCGVPWVEAPGESDAQCARWVRESQVDAAVTQDYDAALHGSPITYRNLTSSTKRPAERMELSPALSREGITRTQLVDAAILIGTDYNDGIRGVGPVTALKLVKEHGDLFGALEARDVAMPEAEAIRALFLDHPVDTSAPPRFTPPEVEGVRTVLAEHGLSKQRADGLCQALGRF